MFRRKTGDVTGLSAFLLPQGPATYCGHISRIVSLSLSNAINALCYSLLILGHLFVHFYHIVLLGADCCLAVMVPPSCVTLFSHHCSQQLFTGLVEDTFLNADTNISSKIFSLLTEV